MGLLDNISETWHASMGPLTVDQLPGIGLPASPTHG